LSIRMRTPPTLPAPHVRLGPDGTRPPAGGGASISLLQPPGTYTVTLAAGGREFTQTLVVRKDPHSAGTEADIAAQTAVLTALRRDLDAAVALVNRMELVRSQLQALGRVTKDAEITKAAAAVEAAFTDLEMTLIDLRLTGAQDTIRYGAQLVSRFGHLANGLAVADFRPTDQQVAVQQWLAGQVQARTAEFEALVAKDLAAFNATLRARGITHVVSR